MQLHGDSVAGMMETCAQIDSISERQLPWVNGGVILLEPLLCFTLPSSTGEHPSLPRLSFKGEEANGLCCTQYSPLLPLCISLLSDRLSLSHSYLLILLFV